MDPHYLPLYLPSKGVLYDGKIPDGKVHGRKMTVADIGAFESSGGSAVDKIDRMLRACTKLPEGFDHADLLMTDRMGLLLGLRVLTHDAPYTLPFRCEFCGKDNRASIDMKEDLVLREVKDGLIEPLTVTLPDARVTVHARFLRGRDEDQVAKYAKRMNLSKTMSNDSSLAYRLALCITSIDGQGVTLLDRVNFCKAMSLSDLNTMSSAIEDAEPGFEDHVVVDCAKCNAPNKVTLELTAEFFRPSRR